MEDGIEKRSYAIFKRKRKKEKNQIKNEKQRPGRAYAKGLGVVSG